MTTIENLTTIDNTLAYLMDRLGWPISEDSPAVNAYDANWEYYPEDLGLKDSDFAKITSLQQMKPFNDDQDWAVFFLEFDYKRMQITVLRKILGALIFNKRGARFSLLRNCKYLYQQKSIMATCQIKVSFPGSKAMRVSESR